MTATLRPLRIEDGAAALRVTDAAFSALDRQTGEEPEPFTAADEVNFHTRARHFAATDPGGAWVAEEDGEIAGVALALVREGLWGLSLLIVDPSRQSRGIGRMLFDACLAYGDGSRGGLVIASDDPRALRSYHRAGFLLEPTYRARGEVRADRLPTGAAVREGALADLELAARVDRAVRGAAHGPDWELVVAGPGGRLLVLEDRGYAILRERRIYAVAALDEEAAATLLVAALRATAGGTADVSFISAAQGWALDVCFAAGLSVAPSSSLCRRGEVGPLRPYLPSGAYL